MVYPLFGYKIRSVSTTVNTRWETSPDRPDQQGKSFWQHCKDDSLWTSYSNRLGI